MKQPLVITLLLALALVSKGQDYSKPKDTTRTLHELGVNATFFVANFLTFSGNVPVSVDPYAFQYKVLAHGKNGVRFGFGGNYRSFDQSEDDFVDVTSTTMLNARLGYEHRIQIAKKWKVFFGADAIWAYENAKTTTENGFQNVSVADVTRSLGAGAVFGIQFFANKRISLGTETSAQFLFTEFENRTDISGNFPSTDKTKSELTEFNFMLPTSIYVNIALGKAK